ncbi:helix-turn-helix domain-containing protein [Kineococcus rhizosphaerae]|uniref:Xre family transcriptional regulator n=1 Tax=Kineococcus rhizosphaerae TaxID=559628 RepID=A0A2T0R1N8_9ACTN|nr:helix-turn-helix domain-containing protein [Kineococcus rhizosphaerae]PRY13487.1 Xre family transcriptional regulator [Kineococcus rhizosphaerae]
MSALGDFLRARRAAVSPAEAGLPAGTRRRVPGLRRSEVALLAEISVEYYVRLEQGRERGPSPAVLDALAAALRLTRDGAEHLYRLAGLAPAPLDVGPERVDPRLTTLLAAWPGTPAVVLGRALDVLAANDLAEELFGGFPTTRNLVEFVFLAPQARTLYPDWNVVARNTVAAFRLADGAHPGDPRLRAVREALRDSEEFTRLWDRHDARGKTAERKRFAHPRAGEFTLDVQTFDVRDGAGQQLAVYHAAPGTPSADALTLLGMLAAQRGTQTTSTNTGFV